MPANETASKAPPNLPAPLGRQCSRPTRALIGQPSGLLPRLALPTPAPAHEPRPRTAYHVCIMQPRLMQCARQMLHSRTIHHNRQQRSIRHSLLCKVRLQSPSPRPEVSCKHAARWPGEVSLACKLTTQKGQIQQRGSPEQATLSARYKHSGGKTTATTRDRDRR